MFPDKRKGTKNASDPLGLIGGMGGGDAREMPDPFGRQTKQQTQFGGTEKPETRLVQGTGQGGTGYGHEQTGDPRRIVAGSGLGGPRTPKGPLGGPSLPLNPLGGGPKKVRDPLQSPQGFASDQFGTNPFESDPFSQDQPKGMKPFAKKRPLF